MTASTSRTSLFCDTALAARIERAEVDLISTVSRAAAARSGIAGFVTPLAGGAASFAGAESPYTKVVGLGFDGVPTDDELAAVEQAYAAHGAPTSVELAHLGDPDLAALLSDRGYRLEGYENVLGLDLTTATDLPVPAGIEVRRSGDDELEAWLPVIVEASTHPDTQGVPWHDDFPAEAIEAAQRDSAAAGLTRYAAFRDGVLAGGAEFRTVDGIAQLAGAGTAPAHRRHGVQSAMLAARLADARALGCDVAVIVTQPGSTSHQNAQRRGFDLLYTRATLVRQP
ncbi:GNAT family N-acetyltransferase [Actinomycetospora sp. NBRC 106375]|uniref:GNAT family N-acetyltransferase n=1 Tax=Actinomycetospora sp. NBRC 106375 TaxID=3032207 RepID=UPI002556043E|nr:GNAT family N-acetyltransferase [Actinomycetospora sp. NBRC 106375]